MDSQLNVDLITSQLSHQIESSFFKCCIKAEATFEVVEEEFQSSTDSTVIK